MKVRKEILKLRQHHDSLQDQITNINRIISSFESNLTKEERASLSSKLKGVVNAVAKLKDVVPKE